MYASIRRYPISESKWDEIAGAIRDEFVPIISAAPGFRNYYLVKGGPNVLATVSVFETQAQAEDSNRLAADFVGRRLASLIEGPPEITSGEILANASAQAAGGATG